MKMFLATLICVFSFFANASTSIPPLSYSSDVKVGDCFYPKKNRFPVFVKVKKINQKEKSFTLALLFQTEKDKYFEKPMGDQKWEEKPSEVWDKVTCPVSKK